MIFLSFDMPACMYVVQHIINIVPLYAWVSFSLSRYPNRLIRFVHNDDFISLIENLLYGFATQITNVTQKT